MVATWDLLVVGGGIVGAAAAFHGARAGARVLVVDRDDPGRATAAGAGIVSPETDIHQAGPYFELARRAADHYPELLDALPSRSGYARCGMLVVAADDAEVREHDVFVQRALEGRGTSSEVPAGQTVSGVSHPSDRSSPPDAGGLQTIDPREARERFPALAQVRRALWNPRGARVDGREVTAALHQAAAALGAQRRLGSVEELLLAAARGGSGSEARVVAGARIDGERHAAAAVIVAGGAWSDALLAPIGVRVPVLPQRGQIAHLGLEGIDTAPWPMVSGFRDHYLVAWPGGRLVAGATRETGSGFDVRTTAAGVREVLAEALRLAPGLASATLLEVRVGLRPLASDGLPILGPVPARPGLWLATGHGPAGLTLGPYSAKLVVDAALGGQWPERLAAFALDRFTSGAPPLRQAKKNSSPEN